MENSGTFIMKGGGISFNTTVGNGGGVANSGGKMTLSGVYILTNKATTKASSQGGGIYVLGGTVTLKNDGIGGGGGNQAGNRAGSGGGIFISSGTVNITGGTIAYNSASGTPVKAGTPTGNGGGIYNYKGSMTIQTGVKVTENQAVNEGGGMYFAIASSNTFLIGMACNINGNLIAGGNVAKSKGLGAYQQEIPGVKPTNVTGWTPGINVKDTDDPNQKYVPGP